MTSEHNPLQSRKKKIRFFLILAVCLLAGAGYLYRLSTLNCESTDDAFIDGRYTQVSPRVSGHILSVAVNDNQWVSAGDLLVELDPADYQARLDSAIAALKAARADAETGNLSVDIARTAARAEEETAAANLDAAAAAVESAQARLGRSKISLALARAEANVARAKHQRDATDLARYQKMSKTEIVTRQNLEHMTAEEKMSAASLVAAEKKIDTQSSQIAEAQAALKSARATLHQAQAAATLARSAPTRVAQSRSRAAAAVAEMEKAEAALAQARLNLSYTRIYAPVDGFVTRLKARKGALVQTGEALAALVPKNLWVTANFKETQLAGIGPGQAAEIRVDAYPDIVLTGRVDSIQHGTGSVFSLLPPENATGNFVKVVQRVPVKILLDPGETLKGLPLTPGMSVLAKVRIDKVRIDKKASPKMVAAADRSAVPGKDSGKGQ